MDIRRWLTSGVDAVEDWQATFEPFQPDASLQISDEQFAAIKTAGYTDQELVEISLAVALITFTNVFNRINGTDIDFPAVN